MHPPDRRETGRQRGVQYRVRLLRSLRLLGFMGSRGMGIGMGMGMSRSWFGDGRSARPNCSVS